MLKIAQLDQKDRKVEAVGLKRLLTVKYARTKIAM